MKAQDISQCMGNSGPFCSKQMKKGNASNASMIFRLQILFSKIQRHKMKFIEMAITNRNTTNNKLVVLTASSMSKQNIRQFSQWLK